ncbi:uncharacterized protein LOC124277273 isoform X2 [Haliotis rubra]|nr:uncharacterized protein LOC124277273 isoform X2 [Haliotis rubra]XP_046568883.1 uncharacterized protein LOC124277273 isoform X2 [Haliotis rubra]XP_046568884.1 uncharacterized protein LOC124277273 isoform X2 [Haliotis rubra]XP_046568885.1 uncharacterized protein LOC124277273 isoform X2 [Haliotis rubra]
MMEGTLQLLLVWALLTVDVVTCQCVKDSDELSFSRQNSEADDVHRDHFVSIRCCANNFVGEIQWYRYENGIMTSFDYGNYTFHQRRQVLDIQKASMKDNGTYICLASNGTNNVTFVFELYVAECDKSVGKVIVERRPDPKQIVQLGQSITLECRGYFGCGLQNTRDAFWMRKLGKADKLLSGDNEFYSVERVNKSNGNILGSILTFKTITEDNMTSRYVCVLFSPPPNGHSFPIELVPLPQKEVLPTWGVAVVAVSVILVVLVMFLLVVQPWRDQLLFRIRTKCHRLPPRLTNMQHDVIVLCHPANEDEVKRHVTSYLRNYYTVFFPYDDIPEGQLEAQGALEALQSSSYVLIYVEPSDERVPRLDFLMKAATDIQQGARIILVHNGRLTDSLQGLEYETRSRLQHVHRIKWPTDIDSNARVKKNFLCAIQSYLPESLDNTEPSSQEPLLGE